MSEPTVIDATPARHSDIQAILSAETMESGRAHLTLELHGERGGKRREAVVLGAGERRALIVALGGTP